MLVYDGECGFCARAVQFLLRRDPGGELLFAARDGEAGRAVRTSHPKLAQVESLLWVDRSGDEERVLTLSSAALTAVVYLGGMWKVLGRAGLLTPRFLRDAVYGVIARVRRRIAGRVDPSCMLVPAAEQHRFLG